MTATSATIQATAQKVLNIVRSPIRCNCIVYLNLWLRLATQIFITRDHFKQLFKKVRGNADAGQNRLFISNSFQ